MILKTTTIKIPIYYMKLRIIVEDVMSEPEFAAYVKINGDLISVNLTKDATPGIIAHEAVHITNCIFDSRLMELSLTNDEPYAYLLGWVVDKIHNTLNKD